MRIGPKKAGSFGVISFVRPDRQDATPACPIARYIAGVRSWDMRTSFCMGHASPKLPRECEEKDEGETMRMMPNSSR